MQQSDHGQDEGHLHEDGSLAALLIRLTLITLYTLN